MVDQRILFRTMAKKATRVCHFETTLPDKPWSVTAHAIHGEWMQTTNKQRSPLTRWLTRCSRRGRNLLPKLDIKVPSLGTLKKYGLTEEIWIEILIKQGSVCAICKRVPQSGRWVTDHEHVAGFKKLPPHKRVHYVRGIICPFCNSHVVGRFVTLFKSQNATRYLQEHAKRRDSRAVKKILDEPNPKKKRRRRKT